MKVFELMNQLAEMPAGADVKFSRLTSVKELIEGDNMSGPDEEPYYTLEKNILEVEESESCNVVYLYSD